RNRADGASSRARQPGRRRARHAVAPGAAGVRGLVWRTGYRDPGVARGDAGDLRGTAVIILGLTGSIGMGKSTAAGALRRLGVPLYDADAEIHRMLGKGGAAVAAVERAFPGVRGEDGAIDRRRLGQRVFGRPEELRRLEHILHPMVRAVEQRWLARARARRARLVVLDIPLLFETSRIDRVDGVIVVSAPARVQRERVLGRPGMSASRLDAILRTQYPDDAKRRRADFIVTTALSRAAAARQLKGIVRRVRQGEWRRNVRLRRLRGRTVCAKS